MKLTEVTQVLQGIAPLELAEDWDNVGLLAGDGGGSVRRIMLAIDMTAGVLAEARGKKVDLLVAYHPPIWEPLKRVVAGEGGGHESGSLIYQAIRSGVAVYAVHTALDCAAGGVNDVLADIVGIVDAEPLAGGEVQAGRMFKLVVFLPEGDLEKVSGAIFAAGAGHIGEQAKYSKCSFRCKGVGTFEGDAESNPTVGQAGRFEQADEVRLETVVPAERIGEVVRAMVKAHSYEEVAYDIVPVVRVTGATGLGRCGELAEPMGAGQLVEKIKRALKVKTAGVIGPTKRQVKRAAVCAGSAGTMLREVIKKGCDFYLTGELKHHHALELQAAGVTCVCAGHWASERVVLPVLARQIRQGCAGVSVTVSRSDADVFAWL